MNHLHIIFVNTTVIILCVFFHNVSKEAFFCFLPSNILMISNPNLESIIDLQKSKMVFTISIT